MTAFDTFPYVEGTHPSESDEHVNMKGLAVYWLLNRGFELDEIEEEYPVEPTSTGRGDTRYVDIHAERDGHEVFVECERTLHNARNVSLGGKQMAKKGEAVFVFSEEMIYQLVFEEVDNGNDWGTRRHQLREFSNLPMLDLSAYE